MYSLGTPALELPTPFLFCQCDQGSAKAQAKFTFWQTEAKVEAPDSRGQGARSTGQGARDGDEVEVGFGV